MKKKRRPTNISHIYVIFVFVYVLTFKRMRHVTPFFFQGIRSTNVDIQRRPIFDFDFRGTLRAKSLSLKRINTFERLLKLKNKRQRLQNHFKNFLSTLSYEEAGNKLPDKRKFNFDNFYPKYKRLQFAQTYFAGKAK